MRLYCPYCLEPKGDKFACCQEADFVPFEDLDDDQQELILEDEADE